MWVARLANGVRRQASKAACAFASADLTSAGDASAYSRTRSPFVGLIVSRAMTALSA